MKVLVMRISFVSVYDSGLLLLVSGVMSVLIVGISVIGFFSILFSKFVVWIWLLVVFLFLMCFCVVMVE